MGTKLSSKYGQKHLDSAIKSTTDAIKNASKRAIQKTVKPTGDLVSNKIAYKITSVSKVSPAKLCSQNNEANNELETPKERYITSEKRQQVFDELRLV